MSTANTTLTKRSISIHAPARGATPYAVCVQAHGAISIHAPARGATNMAEALIQLVNQFQSTLPRGERHSAWMPNRRFDYFNPRSREGSDWIDRVYWPMVLDFNPRSREGSDSGEATIDWYPADISIHAPARGATADDRLMFDSGKFQSTLPRGERQAGCRL